MLTNVLETESGSIILSVIVGLGLASFFRKVCKDGRCVVIKGPDVKEISETAYKLSTLTILKKGDIKNCRNILIYSLS